MAGPNFNFLQTPYRGSAPETAWTAYIVQTPAPARESYHPLPLLWPPGTVIALHTLFAVRVSQFTELSALHLCFFREWDEIDWNRQLYVNGNGK